MQYTTKIAMISLSIYLLVEAPSKFDIALQLGYTYNVAIVKVISEHIGSYAFFYRGYSKSL